MSQNLPKPIINADSTAYWNAARERKLLIRKCQHCNTLHFMPRYLCPKCWSDKLEWVESSGLGRVYSFSIIRRAPLAEFAVNTPYVTALIELDEGPRMVTNILGENALSVSINDRVEVTFEDRGDGAFIPQFKRICI